MLFITLPDKYLDLTDGIRRKGQVNCKLFSGVLHRLFLKIEIRSPSVRAGCSLFELFCAIVREFEPIEAFTSIFRQIRKNYSLRPIYVFTQSSYLY